MGMFIGQSKRPVPDSLQKLSALFGGDAACRGLATLISVITSSILTSSSSSAASISILNMNRLPVPLPSDMASIMPPHCSTIFLQTVRPSPMPSEFCFAVRFSLPNSEKTVALSCFIPEPVSFTCTFRLLLSFK